MYARKSHVAGNRTWVFVFAVLLLRGLEIVWALISFVALSAMAHWIVRPVLGTWSIYDALYASGLVIVWYYVAFGYLFVSLAGLVIAWLLGMIKSRRIFAVANVGIFMVHSTVVIAAIFGGALTMVFWAMWLLILCFNVIVPIRVWSAFLPNRDPQVGSGGAA